ncbi:MAG: hypothetical protein JJD93_17240 [Ilumatobacteraceae bacterium]|nr:hypothetical protein [Ilumatobacteraceae bacterium]
MISGDAAERSMPFLLAVMALFGEPLNFAECRHQRDVLLMLVSAPRVHKNKHPGRFVGSQHPRRIEKADVQIDGGLIDIELPVPGIGAAL